MSAADTQRDGRALTQERTSVNCPPRGPYFLIVTRVLAPQFFATQIATQLGSTNESGVGLTVACPLVFASCLRLPEVAPY
jgi:hypothetical protein